MRLGIQMPSKQSQQGDAEEDRTSDEYYATQSGVARLRLLRRGIGVIGTAATHCLAKMLEKMICICSAHKGSTRAL